MWLPWRFGWGDVVACVRVSMRVHVCSCTRHVPAARRAVGVSLKAQTHPAPTSQTRLKISHRRHHRVRKYLHQLLVRHAHVARPEEPQVFGAVVLLDGQELLRALLKVGRRRVVAGGGSGCAGARCAPPAASCLPWRLRAAATTYEQQLDPPLTHEIENAHRQVVEVADAAGRHALRQPYVDVVPVRGVEHAVRLVGVPAGSRRREHQPPVRRLLPPRRRRCRARGARRCRCQVVRLGLAGWRCEVDPDQVLLVVAAACCMDDGAAAGRGEQTRS
jgi:hypothetical protein